MFFKKKKKEIIIENTPKGTCGSGACSSCSIGNGEVESCSTTTNQINSKPTSARNKISNIIAIGSGKGGVGKSTVTTNLAYALKENGFNVGILDADIYGPSQATMMGSKKEKVIAFDGMIRPIEKNSIKSISMANLNTGNTPTIWRAPIAIQAIEQLLHGVHWGELDYLLIDLPPGTGDIQLTLCQQINLTGALIVSTPQKVAAQVSLNGLKMFKQLNVPIIGIVENMANFNCPSCHTNSKLYKGNYLNKIAKEERTSIISSIPLDANIMQASDEGESVMSFAKESASAKAYKELAKNVGKILKVTTSENLVDSYRLQNTGELELVWKDGKNTTHSPISLRKECKCAFCIDEKTGKKILNPTDVDKDIKITNIVPVGLYGMGVHFSDGHKSGIYQLSELRQ